MTCFAGLRSMDLPVTTFPPLITGQALRSNFPYRDHALAI